jgi:hypothetical protein
MTAYPLLSDLAGAARCRTTARMRSRLWDRCLCGA